MANFRLLFFMGIFSLVSMANTLSSSEVAAVRDSRPAANPVQRNFDRGDYYQQRYDNAQRYDNGAYYYQAPLAPAYPYAAPAYPSGPYPVMPGGYVMPGNPNAFPDEKAADDMYRANQRLPR